MLLIPILRNKKMSRQRKMQKKRTQIAAHKIHLLEVRKQRNIRHHSQSMEQESRLWI